MSYRVSVLYKTAIGTKSNIFIEPNTKKALAWLQKGDNAMIVEIEVHNVTTGRLVGRTRGSGAPF